MRKNTRLEEKRKVFVEHILPDLISRERTHISNTELMKVFKNDYGYNLSEIQLNNMNLRGLLEQNGILDSRTYQEKVTRSILDNTIQYIQENNIEIQHVNHFHDLSQKFGQICRVTIDNHLNYIAKKIPLKKLSGNRRIKNLDIADKELVAMAGKYYLAKNIFQVRAADMRRYIFERYRPVDIQIIYDSKDFLLKNYGIVVLNKDITDKSVSLTSTSQIKDYLRSFEKPIKVKYITSKINSYSANDEDSFIVLERIKNNLETLWKNFLQLYVEGLVGSRINVKNGVLDQSGKLSLDTDKKKVVFLLHDDLHIRNLELVDIIKLSYNNILSSQKHYGIHFQNLYISFLLFLYSRDLLLLPFSYLHEVCYKGKKVTMELAYFMARNEVNKQLLRAIQENRLEEKDDKYKRIIQFFLLSFPNDHKISDIKYEDVSILRNKQKKDFNRVVKTLNSLGADIDSKAPKMKYVNAFIKYKKNPKYNQLIELFEKTMNRVAKLGSYGNEQDVFKDYSGAYSKFIDFLDANFSNNEITENFLYRVFNYPDEANILTYQEYTEELNVSSNTKERRFTPLIVAFQQSDWKSLHHIKDNKPLFSDSGIKKGKTLHKPITNYDALEKIKEVLTMHPPVSDYYKVLNIDERHTSWWPHYSKVAPFEPLILLMHLHIPARGGNFRHADRNNFLEYNEKNTVVGYHFGHDKNKKRKKPYIAPNIWQNELGFVEDLVAYSKVHFPNLKPIKVDKQNPQGIVPLFPNADGTGFYTEAMHMKYWKKVLLKAQILLNNDPEAEQCSLIYSKEEATGMPKTLEEVDLLSEGEMDNFTPVYTLHSLRHTGATRYANAGMPYGLLMLLTGHVDPSTLQNIYVEIDRAKMLREWEEVSRKTLGEIGMSIDTTDLFLEIDKKLKQVLSTKNPKEIFEFLEQGKFISIGSYLGQSDLIQYTNEDFSKIDPIFWTPKGTGYCTSNTCPNGLENRCSLCPYFITSSLFLEAITAFINLQNQRLIKYVNMIITNRENGLANDNQALRKSAQIELEDLMGWMEIIKAVDNVSGDNLSAGNEESKSKELQVVDKVETAIYNVTKSHNPEHTLLRVVFENLEAKRFVHEGMFDAMETLVGKLIRYAAKNGRYMEINGKDTIQILEWFQPQYRSMIECGRKSGDMSVLVNFLEEFADISINNGLKQLTR